jgi:sensor histidine kinase regulating citrate/malate metabolism
MQAKEDCTMGYTDRGNTEGTSTTTDEKHVVEDYVWATDEEAKLRAQSLYLIQSIVERHGGTVDIDVITDTINIKVPEKEQAACAQEIEEQVGTMCH